MPTFRELRDRYQMKQSEEHTTNTKTANAFCLVKFWSSPDSEMTFIAAIIAVYLTQDIDFFNPINDLILYSDNNTTASYDTANICVSYVSAFGHEKISEGKYSWRIKINSPGDPSLEKCKAAIVIGITTCPIALDSVFYLRPFAAAEETDFAVMLHSPANNVFVRQPKDYYRWDRIYNSRVIPDEHRSPRFLEDNNPFQLHDSDEIEIRLNADENFVEFYHCDDFVVRVSDLDFRD